MSDRTLTSNLARATMTLPPLVAAFQRLRDRAYTNPETRDLLDAFIARLTEKLTLIANTQSQRYSAFGEAAYDSEDVEQHERAGRYEGRAQAFEWLSSELVFLAGRNLVPRNSTAPLFSLPAAWAGWPEPEMPEESAEERRASDEFDRWKARREEQRCEREFHAQSQERREEAGGVQ